VFAVCKDLNPLSCAVLQITNPGDLPHALCQHYVLHLATRCRPRCLHIFQDSQPRVSVFVGLNATQPLQLPFRMLVRYLQPQCYRGMRITVRFMTTDCYISSGQKGEAEPHLLVGQKMR
jgi:hypothetical protein